jgi:hypothetical protein
MTAAACRDVRMRVNGTCKPAAVLTKQIPRERRKEETLKKYREFSVKPVINGFVATIGCSKVVFTDAASLSVAICSYLVDPAAAEKDFLENRDFRHEEVIRVGWGRSPFCTAFTAEEQPKKTDE